MATNAQTFASIDELLVMLGDHAAPELLWSLLFVNRRFYTLFRTPFLVGRLDWDPDKVDVIVQEGSGLVTFRARPESLEPSRTTSLISKAQRTFTSLLLQDRTALRTVCLTTLFMMRQNSIVSLAGLFPNITTLVIQDSQEQFDPKRNPRNNGVLMCISGAVKATERMKKLTTLKIKRLGVVQSEVSMFLYDAAERIARNVLKNRAEDENEQPRQMAVTMCFSVDLCRRCPVCQNTANEDPSAERLGVFREELVSPMVYLPKKAHNFRVPGATDHWEWIIDGAFEADLPPTPPEGEAGAIPLPLA